MADAGLVESIRRRFEDAVPAPADPKFIRSGTEPQLRVPAALFQRIALCLKEEYRFDLLNTITAVDYPKEDRFELAAQFLRTEDPSAEIWVKTSLPRAGEPEAPSLAPVYAAADWQEREIYDLFGIRFKGHPNLRRILLWEGYPGWPLRKDYVHTPDRYDNGQEIGLPKAGA